jgi:hypothetical protein
LDSIGGVVYLIGLLSSLLGFRSQGALIGAVGLGLVVVFYLRDPLNDLLALDHPKYERVGVGIALVFGLFLLVRLGNIALLCIGAIFFLWGCVSLKRRKIYIGREWRLEDRTCYTRSDHPVRYWLLTLLFLSFGIFLLVYLLLTNLWHVYEMRRR